jgi:methyltransferase (TIGR00027 family)
MALEGVSETALGAAEMRAEESLRPDRQFNDGYAALFVAAAPPLFPGLPSIDDDPELARLKDAFRAEIALRTRFYDEFLTQAGADGCRQVVLLAAGLDARAFRLDWPPGVHVFELDLPDLFRFKEAVLTKRDARPRCERTVVPVDLRDDWPARLADAGFVRPEPCAWVAEGLLAYLTHDEVAHLLADVGDLSAGGSQLAFEYDDFVEDSTLSRAQAATGMEAVSSMWEGGLRGSPATWLREHGWAVGLHDRATLARTYGGGLPSIATGGFVVASRPAGK